MKALSVQQPWPWLIVNGYKPIENRNWSTEFRGEFLLHAGKRIDHEGIAFVEANFPEIELPSTFDTGGIVGKSTLVDVVTQSDSRWFFGEYGFVLRESKSLPFTSLRGQLGFFNVDVSILQKTETSQAGCLVAMIDGARKVATKNLIDGLMEPSAAARRVKDTTDDVVLQWLKNSG